MLRGHLLGLGLLTDELDEGFREAAKREVNEATDFAEAAAYPGTEGFNDHVYSTSSSLGGAPSP